MKEIEITQIKIRVIDGFVHLTSYDQMNDMDCGPIIPIAQWDFIKELVDNMIDEDKE